MVAVGGDREGLGRGAQAVDHRGDGGTVVGIAWPGGGDVTDGCAWSERSHLETGQGVCDGEPGYDGDAEPGSDERLDRDGVVRRETDLWREAG
jgi:hypothetical protein